MRLHIYIKSVGAKGSESWLKVGESDTWRGTHEFRTLTKEQRKTKDGTAVMSYVYDERGHLLCTP